MFDADLITLLAVALGAGAVGGVLAGLLGVGGGIVIVPALYFALTQADIAADQAIKIAVGTSLLTIAFTAISSSWAHHKRGAIDRALLAKWLPWIAVGSVLGGALGSVMPQKAMVSVFALTAGVIAIDMILRRPPEVTTPRDMPKAAWAAFGTFCGGISAIMGIGGGSVCVPALSFLGYDIRKAVGNSSLTGLAIAVPGALSYAFWGWGQADLPDFSVGYVNLFAAAIIIPMTMIFAQFGAHLAHHLPRPWLRWIFAGFLLLSAVRMALDLLN